MRISDWSSDVCSSDLGRLGLFESPFVISFVIELNESLQPVTIPLADARHVFVSKGFLRKFVGKLQVPFGLAAKSQIKELEMRPRSEERRVGQECVGTCRSR